MPPKLPDPNKCFALVPPHPPSGEAGARKRLQCQQPASLGQCSAGIVIDYNSEGAPRITQNASAAQCAFAALTKEKDVPKNYIGPDIQGRGKK